VSARPLDVCFAPMNGHREMLEGVRVAADVMARSTDGGSIVLGYAD
jgi:hypothetical protein